jgi:predicted GIY-YIG superfamily endonuclease
LQATERWVRRNSAALTLAGLCATTALAVLAIVYARQLYEAARPTDGRLTAVLDVMFTIGAPIVATQFLLDHLWQRLTRLAAELASLRQFADEVADPTFLYRLFDADGALLYVGITRTLDRRMQQHALKQPWWPEVAKTVTTEYRTRAQAARAEHAAIEAENPRHNAMRLPRAAHMRSALTR